MKKLVLMVMFLIVGFVFSTLSYADFSGYAAVWEEKACDKQKKEEGYVRKYILQYFGDFREAIKYLNENEVEKQPWETKWTGWIVVSSSAPEKGKFIGLFKLGRQIMIKKVMQKVELKKEVWIEE